MSMTEFTAYTPEMPWEELSLFPGDAEVKVLRSELEHGARTLLVRIPPGGEISPHGHLGVVQHYVLEGEYETLGETFGAGTYRLLPKHENLATISTERGAVILMMYDPV
jgi:ChrR Cupin-like domain